MTLQVGARVRVINHGQHDGKVGTVRQGISPDTFRSQRTDGADTWQHAHPREKMRSLLQIWLPWCLSSRSMMPLILHL